MNEAGMVRSRHDLKRSCFHATAQGIGRVAKESREPSCGPLRRMLVERMSNSHSEFSEMVRRLAARFFSTVGLLLVMLGCQGENHAAMATHRPWDRWQAGHVVDTRTGLPVPMNSWLEKLTLYDTIYLGEEHHNRFHIDAALLVLRSLMEQGRRPVLAMEMFGWDGQPALDEYLSSNSSLREEFLERVRWKQNWGGAFEDYEPLVKFAKEHQLPILAMNPPKTLIRQVVKQGLVQIKAQAEWQQWGMESEIIADAPAYRSRILSQLEECHGGGSPDDYQRMYEASMVRDEAMAKTLAVALRRIRSEGSPVQGPMLSYTGGGHVQYGLPVPNRVARRIPEGVKQMTVYMATFEAGRADELWQAMSEGIADYVWLTPQASQGPPRRCR